jgi:arylsulfatase A-like enzyme
LLHETRSVTVPAALRPRLGESFALAAWIGLVTGFGEVILLAIKSQVFHKWIWVGRQAVWMAPTADLVLFTLVGGGLFLLGRRWHRANSFRTQIFVLIFLAAWALLLFAPRVDEWALLVLAVGSAWQAGRVLAARQELVHRLVGRTLPLLLVFLACLGVGFNAWTALKERRALATLAPAVAGTPNLLLLVVDTERAMSLRLYGYGRSTSPNVEQFARDGATFEQAFSAAPWTLPSHASMFTGQYTDLLSPDYLHALDDRYPTLAERLRALGYATAGFVANTYYTSAEFGLGRGFIHYEDYDRSPTEMLLNISLGRRVSNSTTLHLLLGYHDVVGRKRAPDLNRSLIRWIDRRRGRPFFAFVNYYDVHEPYLPPEPFDTLFGASDQRRDFARVTFGERNAGVWPWRRGNAGLWLWRKRETSEEALQAEHDAYDAGVAYVDHHLGRLFIELKQRGLLDNTVIVLTSDHGEQFGEHRDASGQRRLYTHGNSLYAQAIHVPLVLRYPRRIPAGVRVPEPVTLRDLGATLLDLAGAPDVHFPGQSLAERWGSADMGSPSSPVLSSLRMPSVKGNPSHSIVVGQYHYIRNEDGGEVLFDLATDPGEARDLASTPHGLILLPPLRAAMDSVLAQLKRERL